MLKTKSSKHREMDMISACFSEGHLLLPPAPHPFLINLLCVYAMNPHPGCV